MSESFTLRTQVTCVMETVVRDAVAQICKLVEEEWRLEMLQRDGEIADLARRLRAAERELVARAHVNRRSVGIQADTQQQVSAECGGNTVKIVPFGYELYKEESDQPPTPIPEPAAKYVEEFTRKPPLDCDFGLEFVVKVEPVEYQITQHTGAGLPRELALDDGHDWDNIESTGTCARSPVSKALPIPNPMRKAGRKPARSSFCGIRPAPIRKMAELGGCRAERLHVVTLTPGDVSHAGFSAGAVWRQRCGTREKRFVCAHCGKRFDRFSHLERHERIHTGEKPYRCVTCGKCFTQKSSLKGHQKVHMGMGAYEGDACHKIPSFHIPTRVYTCYVCAKTFPELSALKQHQRIHPGRQ